MNQVEQSLFQPRTGQPLVQNFQIKYNIIFFE